VIGETIARRPESRSGLWISVGIHGVIAAAAVGLLGHATPNPAAPVIELVELAPAEVADPGPRTATSHPPAATGSPSTSRGRSGRRGHTPSREQLPNVDPYASLTASVDHGATIGSGTGDHGLGTGQGLYGNGSDAMPGGGVGEAARGLGVPSLRREPSPREDYSLAAMAFDPDLAGHTVVVRLALDIDGHVIQASVAKSSGDTAVDARIVDSIRRYEFYPALDDTGKPVASTYRWLWVLQPPFCPEAQSTVSTRDKRPCMRAR